MVENNYTRMYGTRPGPTLNGWTWPTSTFDAIFMTLRVYSVSQDDIFFRKATPTITN